MSQHFLLSAKARTLSLARVMRLSDAEAYETFKAVRWAANDGQAICPHCGSVECYEYRTRRIFKCKGCGSQFSVTTGTIFASRKMSHRDLLAAIAIFVNGAKGYSALQLSRDLDCQYKTAFVLAHKLREVISDAQDETKAAGHVEVDGAYFGGYVKPANRKNDRLDRRTRLSLNGKRQPVIVVRERRGKSITFIAKSESAAAAILHNHVAAGSTVYADEASAWDRLHARFAMKRINHSEAYSADGACTNWAESYFSRLRRAEIGTHHHIAGPYLEAYADEIAWREDHRRVSNGEQYKMIVSAALAHGPSRDWKGYWQRSAQ